MGLITTALGFLFGGGRNVISQTAGAFMPNAEAQAQRNFQTTQSAQGEFSAEMQYRGQRGFFDRFVDGLNRLPRPIIVFACFGVLVYTPVDPIRMAKVFTAWALIPVGLWSIIATVVAFYFGGRMQIKAQDFRNQMAGAASAAPKIVDAMKGLDDLRHDSPGVADTHGDSDLTLKAVQPDDNRAVSDWRNNVGR